MSGYNKLVPEIIQSSIWNEPSDIRIVWITFLATKDENGYVRGDVRTIARLANVSTEAAEAAIKAFQEPDPSSHTPDYEGRRIGAAAGGWVVLNHEKYRGCDRRAEHAAYVKAWREKKEAQKNNVIRCDSQVNQSCVSVSVSDSVDSSKKGVQGETQPDKPKRAKWVEHISWTPLEKWNGITNEDYDSWEKAYPAIVIDVELEKATQWLLAHPAESHKSLWRKFITGWFGRAQERGRS